MSDAPGLKPETIAAHALQAVDPATGAVVPPLHSATTYARDENYLPKLQENYIRNGSPTLWHAEGVVAALEGGAEARLFSSGAAATVALFETVSQGRHVVAPSIMYYGTRDWLNRLASLGRIAVSWFDAADPSSLAAAIRPGETDIVWIETPCNPTWEVTDIAAAAQAAHRAGAILAVDSTAAGAVTTRPLGLGADIVFHSATKYLNGHSDVLAGGLVAAKADQRWTEIKALRTKMGSPLGPQEAWLLIRGLRTLFVRYRQCSRSAVTIARHFERHGKIERVLYPGLESHAGHEVARRQMTDGFGGMMSILVKGGVEEAKRVTTSLKVIVPATSLGGCESLAEHRKTVEGPASPVPDNLIRISIGLEAAEDLIADLEQALARI